ncbi:hypothetical protein ACN469_23125 [Corallococcus terminator]
MRFTAEALAAEALHLQPEPVVDGTRPQPLAQQYLHSLLPRHQRGRLLW